MFAAAPQGDPRRLRLSDYRLSETLGRGAMAEVRRAYHKKTMHAVAVKLLSAESHHITAKIEHGYRQKTEGEIAMLFDHPNIIKTYGWGREGADEFIVMELFQGTLLREIIYEKGFSAGQNRVDLLVQMVEALEHIHSKAIVHRDFCPRNILVGDDGTLKVFDFGLSVDLELVKHIKGNRTGTICYMAPELIKRQFTDQRADIYALGVTMYELFTGQRPFPGMDNSAHVMQLINSVPDPPSAVNPRVSPEMDAIILKAMAKDPANRYDGARALMDDLAAIVEDERAAWAQPPRSPRAAFDASPQPQGGFAR